MSTSKVKPKPKSKAKLKTKVKAKTRVKAKTKKVKAKSKVKAKTKKPTKIKQAKIAKPRFTKKQKETLLETIKKIVELRKHKVDGLKSLDHIDRILDQYNQKYTVAQDKFDAIVDFGVEEHRKYISDDGLIALKDDTKASVALYKLLAEVGKGKKKFSEALNQINSIYDNALEE